MSIICNNDIIDSRLLFKKGCGELENINNMNNISPSFKAQEMQNPTGIQKKLKPKQSEFIQKFEKIKSDEVRSKLESIYGDIVEKSDKLKETLSLKNVLEYKKLVKDFMKIASENSHVFSQQNFLDRRGRHRMCSMIKQVDRELDSITQEFVKSHIDHAKVLSSIDAIRGMLVDVMT